MSEYQNLPHGYIVGQRVWLSKPDGYHQEGFIQSLPELADNFPAKPFPYFSVDFNCSDGNCENLWLTADELTSKQIQEN